MQALAAFGDLPLNVDLIVLQQLPHSPAHDIMHVRHPPSSQFHPAARARLQRSPLTPFWQHAGPKVFLVMMAILWTNCNGNHNHSNCNHNHSNGNYNISSG